MQFLQIGLVTESVERGVNGGQAPGKVLERGRQLVECSLGVDEEGVTAGFGSFGEAEDGNFGRFLKERDVGVPV